jgi:hypothetical protein
MQEQGGKDSGANSKAATTTSTAIASTPCATSLPPFAIRHGPALVTMGAFFVPRRFLSSVRLREAPFVLCPLLSPSDLEQSTVTSGTNKQSKQAWSSDEEGVYWMRHHVWSSTMCSW